MRDISNDPHDPRDFTWQWSSKGNALEGYYIGRKWFSWYPQVRVGSRNQNQLHHHGENASMPGLGQPNRHDFNLGDPALIPFDDLMNALQPVIDALRGDRLF